MLPQRHRLDLRHAAPFYTFPHKLHLPQVSLYWLLSRDTLPAQAAIVISKKVAPTAVERNRIKRVLRALLSPLLPSLPTGLQFVMIVKKTAVIDSLEHLRQTLISKLHS